MPDHSVVHRYARCLSYPEWGVGSVTGIYFTGDGDDVRQWARVLFSQGIRTVPAGSLSFVDFSTPDPAADRVERFMTAAQHALAEGDYALAAQRLIYARDADPTNVPVLRMMTLAFWQADNLDGGGARGARLGARRRRAAGGAPLRRAHLRGHGRDRPRRRGRRARRRARARATRASGRGSAGCALRLMDRAGAIEALRRAQRLEPTVEALLDLALALQLAGDLGGEVSACEQAVELDPESARRLDAARPRARAHRPRSASASPPASARSSSARDGEVQRPAARMRARQPPCCRPRRARSAAGRRRRRPPSVAVLAARGSRAACAGR